MTYKPTIRDFLMSKSKQGYMTSGFEFTHPNDIIEETYHELFKGMRLTPLFDEELQRVFCQRYYNSEIGYATFAPFLQKLEYTINVECENLLKMLGYARGLTPEDLLKTTDITNTSNSGNGQHTLNLSSSQPENELDILYNEKYQAITHADVINEQHTKVDNKSTHNMSGLSGGLKMLHILQTAHATPLVESIMAMCEKHFMQLY